jgi:hypothetical protein
MTTFARLFGCALAAPFLLFAHQRAGAQADSTQAARPGWLAREPTRIGNLTPAQRAAASARLEQIERILLQIPELARPQGFEVLPRFYGGAKIMHPDDTQHAGDVVEYQYGLMFFAPSYTIALEGLRCIQITINPTLEGRHTTLRDARGHAIYVELTRGPRVPFATQVYGRIDPSPADEQAIDVLLTSGGELPWRQVTRDEYYDASILFHEGKRGPGLASVRTALEATPFEQWLLGAAARKREREETLKALAGLRSAAEIAELRRQLEETDRETGENLKKSEADDRAENRKNLEMFVGVRDSINAERRRLSPAERRMPALIDSRDKPAGATGRALADPDDPTTWRVLTPDYGFWRARRSPDEVRAVHVHLQAYGTCSNPAVKRALWQVYQMLDWAALNRLLAVPRTR